MNKANKIFSLVLTMLLFIMSVLILSIYDNVKNNTSLRQNQDLAVYFDEDFQLFTLAMAKEVDPSYEILSFSEDVPENVRQQVNDKMYNIIDYVKYNFKSDHNFVYSVKNMKSNDIVSNNLDKINALDDKTKYNFYSLMTYNENGDWIKEGDIQNESFSHFKVDELLSSYYNINIEYNETSSVINFGDYYLSLDKIKINQPKNLEITYIIPENIASYGYISEYINSWENYTGFSVVTLLICTFILALFIICYPIKIVEEVNPFASIKKWKAEINITVLSLLIIFGVMGCIILTGYTLNGYLIECINRFNFNYTDLVVMILNFIAWFLTLLIITMGLFQLKYIGSHGFWRYLKEDTLVGTFFKYLKSKLDMVAEIDLSSPINKTIMKYVLINSVIIFIMVSLWSVGYIFVVIYTFGAFFWIKDKVIKVQDDYQQLLTATQELGKGNFGAEIERDLGIFNSLKIEFNNIKTGFEKAVDEEIKSQNMKNELIGNVSHDLKTPLTCIKNYIVLLQDDSLNNETRQEYLNSLNQYANRLTTLIEDLFEVSKVNSGNIQLNLMNLNIIALLEQTYTESEETLKSKNLTVIKKYAQNDIQLALDGDKTYRIFENLFTNIAKYAMVNSRVYLEVKDYSDQVVIEFKNISETQMNFTADEIVERFVRGDKSRHETGSGLGLAIAKSFTEVQGGSFKIDIDGDLFKAIIYFNKNQKNPME
ncbi:sensor histidine kinase [Thomasclavelia sp.]